MLDPVLETAESSGRSKTIIESLALQALAQWQKDDLPGAFTSLERSLRLAEPEGYIRLFIDLGHPMGRLLQEAQSRGVMPLYVEKLLQVFQSEGLAFGYAGSDAARTTHPARAGSVASSCSRPIESRDS